ncbi:ADP-ribosylglycohydrolase, partial [Dendrothele bispora CBS 962.96]
MTPLHAQHIVPASSSTKIRLSLLATALVDALGGPTEFHRRFSFPPVTSMIPSSGFGLPKGVWTDDTSMALCLARSIASSNARGIQDGFDEHDQLRAYIAWWTRGELSAVGRCFDIGGTVSRSLSIYSSYVDAKDSLEKIKTEMNHESCSGNGSLMRVLPIGLAYWKSESKARMYARRSSTTTHPNEMCQEACEVWIGAIVKTMQSACPTTTTSTTLPEAPTERNLSKLDLLEYFASFPYRNKDLRDALSCAPPTGLDSSETTDRNTQLEAHYRAHHPILKLIVTTSEEITKRSKRGSNINIADPLNLPSESVLPSSGYVLRTLVAALYCFFVSSTFEDGAILAANLGDDSDTVGAVYAGLAGCWYAGDEATMGEEPGAEKDSLFWSKRVDEWKKDLVRRDLVEKVAEELVEFEARW